MARFQHEKLRVYEEAIALVLAVDPLAAKLERRRYYLADQLRRAALSVVLNVAEGAAEFSGAEKARFMNLARRSAGEVVAALVVATRLGALSTESINNAVDQANKVIGMLTRLILHHRGRARKSKTTARSKSQQRSQEEPK